MQIKFRLAFVLGALMFSGAIDANASDNAGDLIDSVVLTRIATLDRIPSAVGIAIRRDQTTRINRAASDLIKTSSDQIIHFRFLKDESFIEVFGVKGTAKQGDRTSTTIVREGIEATYSDDYKRLRIVSYDPVRSLALRPQSRWTYREISRIPEVLSEDENDFIRSLKKGQVSRKINVVIAAMKHDSRKAGVRQSWRLEFDLKCGGMLKNFHSESQYDAVGTGRASKTTTDFSYEWDQVGDLVIPKVRRGKIVVCDPTDPGKQLSIDSVIDYTSFKASEPDSSDFEIKSMNMPAGALVFDELKKLQFIYSPHKPIQLFGNKHPSSLPLTHFPE